MNTITTHSTRHGFELRFASLFVEGRGPAFPCAGNGQVEMDALSERALLNYLYARTVIGREFTRPALRVRHATLH